ncbi:9970_t:CDS:2 [Rhizophagus irregularis]|nr:9970_t:CDS:2 [Rhizophagus irregularis]
MHVLDANNIKDSNAVYRRVNALNIATPETSTTTPASTSEIIDYYRLRPYIPSQPIYSPKGAIYYAPGSTGWFKYLEKKVESAAKAAINQQEHLIKQIEQENKYNVVKKPNKIVRLQTEIANFQLEYFDIITPHQSHYSSFRPDTSNDTKRLEVTTINSNLALQRSLHQEKKLRSSTRSPHDSPVVGPSISK